MSTTTTRLGAPDAREVLGVVGASRRRRLTGMALLGLGLTITIIASLAIGARAIAPAEVLSALWSAITGDPLTDYASTVILTERLPRTVLGLLVGVALGAAGAIMQAVTRNPLVDGSVLGIELGAAVTVVSGALFLGVVSTTGMFWSAMVGALLTAALVFTLARRVRSMSRPVALVISGAAAAAMLASLINLLIVRDETVYAYYRFWSYGQLAGRGGSVADLWPFVLVAVIAALALGGTLNALVLGDRAAAGLGVRVGRAQVTALLVAVVLCAAAVAAAGPIAFIGLVGAHLARLAVGADQRLLVPFAMLAGATVLLAADVAGRLAPGHGEIAVGVMTAFIGVPVFIALARKRRLVET